jgi:NTE family protein
MSSDYFCIFAGGGVRGIAYLGVLQAFEKFGINVTGMAGSSVGAIFASLYALGFNYDEIKEIAFNANYQLVSDLNFNLGKDFGICKGDSFLCWFREQVEKKYYGEKFDQNGNNPVRFRDLDKDLVIIATNLSNTTCKIYSRIETPDEEVAHAVRASISIPGFFKPVWNNDECLIDGDIIGNFPSWRFENHLISNTSSRILELRLENLQKPRKVSNPIEYFSTILDSAYNVSSDLLSKLYGQNDNYDIIRIDVGNISIIDFNISSQEREKLIKKGLDSVTEYFENTLVSKKKVILETYINLQRFLKSFFDEISSNKVTQGRITFGEMLLFMTENKDTVSRDIFSQITETREIFQKSLYHIMFLNICTLKNKSNFIKLLKANLKSIEDEISSLKCYIDNVETGNKENLSINR